MKPKATPGLDGTALLSSSYILRVVSADNMDADLGKINPIALNLTSADKKSEVPHLSAFEDSLTTPDQAIVITDNVEEKVFVCGLNAGQIRGLRPIPDPKPEFPSLDVQWFEAQRPDETGKMVKDTRPGAEGHCGVVGINWGGGGRTDKELRSSLRSQLADLAAADIRHKNF